MNVSKCEDSMEQMDDAYHKMYVCRAHRMSVQQLQKNTSRSISR